jgi:hypothetical protein
MRRLLLIAALLVLPVLHISAQIINATSCSQTAVQTACSSITNSTTTVNIPSCAATNWTGEVTCTVPSGSTASVFTFHGNTTVSGTCLPTCTATDTTIIQDNDTADSNPILNIQVLATNAAEEVRITGLTVQNGTGQTKYNGLVQVNASTDNIRMDNMHFVTSSSGSSSTQWQGCADGVIDHTIFDGGGVSNAVRAYNRGSCGGDPLGVGDISWTQAPGFGGPTFLFMENDLFNAGASDDCTDGGKFVARFNTYNAEAPAPTIQTHPTGGAGRIRGCRASEIYKVNGLPQPSNYIDTFWWDSAGSNMFWGNATTSSSTGGGTGYDAFFKYIEMRQNNNTYSQGVPPAGWGYCGTPQTGSAANWDKNNNSTGYPCFDAPGGGQGDDFTGGFAIDGSGSNNVENATMGCIYNQTCAWPRQTQEGVYMWGNSFSPTPSNPTTFFANQYSGTTINVDYWQDCPGAGCSGSFTGAAGVGQGTLASIPGTCTKGVGYFATDQGTWNHSGSGGQGVLYKCTATNTWTVAYTPYTYPHPLVNATVIDPTGLKFAGQLKITGSVTIQ